ncbi:MAG TPA: hypothetical protein VMH85_10585 [Terriglobales bacterium]|nr:hypothetical protein [Terriglobales bacterium]
MTMASTGVRFGICGTAVVRAADAMLRSLGGAEVSVLFPLSALPGDSSAQLGLVDPGVEEVKFSPVVVLNLPTENTGPRQRVEFLLSASAVAAEAADRSLASGLALLEGALGVMHQGDLFHIEGIVTECFGGTEYLYRVTGVE